MSDESVLDQLLDRWEQAAEEGSDIPAEQLCEQHPELLAQLAAQIEKLRAINAKLRATDPAASDDQTRATSEVTVRDQTSQADVQLLTTFSRPRFLAKGGLGVVFEAEDKRLHRPVALKFMHRRLANDEPSRQRFLLEAEITGRLQHPGVVAVHGLGQTEDGRPFYAMPLVDGETLQAAIDRTHQQQPAWPSERTSFHRLLSHFVSVCRTIAYAHRRKVVHRDIKPDNIMLGRFGETYVLDWGLATPSQQRARDDGAAEKSLVPIQDQPGDDSDVGAGTPAYMSPEQASGQTDLGPETDVYSLGATLYKLLTGKTPFDGRSVFQVKQQVIQGDFPRPTQVKRDVPRALEAICMKAMATQAADRYASASALASELENYLADGAVDAYPEPLSQRVARWGRRHRTFVRTAAVGLMVLLLMGMAFSLWLFDFAHRERLARQQGLRSRARLAANLLGYEIDRRWWQLEAAARDRELVLALTQLDVHPDDPALTDRVNQWLGGVASRSMDGLPAYAWFVNANNGLGTQVARYPYYQDTDARRRFDSIGRSYAHRDYFHGHGPVPPDSPLEEIQPIRHPHLASPFTGTNDQKLLVAFSVPVWKGPAGEGNPVGILGMAVPLGELTQLDAQLSDGQYLSLVYLKEDRLDGTRVRRGLVMHHSGFRNAQQYRPYWVEDASLLRQLNDQAEDSAGERLLPEYHDPLGRIIPSFGQTWIAACANVQLRSRPGDVGRTGWMVILQERP